MKYVSVCFEQTPGNFSKAYWYRTDIEDIEANDDVVVRPSGRRRGAVAKVLEVTDVPKKMATAYIVSKVDYSRYEALLAKEAKKREIIAKLEKKKEEIQELAVYEMLASTDPEAAALLDSLKNL